MSHYRLTAVSLFNVPNKSRMKLVTALIAALAIPTGSMASVADAFDNHNVKAPGGVIDNCFTASNGSLICWQQLTEQPHIRTVAIVDSNTDAAHPTTLFVNCQTNRYEGFGATSNDNMALIAQAACEG